MENNHDFGASDMFDFASYPTIPGDKGNTDTGRAAALDMAPKAPVIRNKVLDVIARRGPVGCTPEEACEIMGMDRLAFSLGSPS